VLDLPIMQVRFLLAPFFECTSEISDVINEPEFSSTPAPGMNDPSGCTTRCCWGFIHTANTVFDDGLAANVGGNPFYFESVLHSFAIYRIISLLTDLVTNNSAMVHMVLS
jgi:hypothetical protein